RPAGDHRGSGPVGIHGRGAAARSRPAAVRADADRALEPRARRRHGGVAMRNLASSQDRPEALSPPAVERAVDQAAAALLRLQRPDGHWAFELEADATIPAEYLLLEHYLDEIDDALEARIAAFLRAGQAEHGGWPLFHGGAFDISASVKAYFAL